MIKIGAKTQRTFVFESFEETSDMKNVYRIMPRRLWGNIKAHHEIHAAINAALKSIGNDNHGYKPIFDVQVADQYGLEEETPRIFVSEATSSDIDYYVFQSGLLVIQVILKPHRRITVDMADLPETEEKALAIACCGSSAIGIETIFSAYHKAVEINESPFYDRGVFSGDSVLAQYPWLTEAGKFKWGEHRYDDLLQIIHNPHYREKTRSLAKLALKTIAASESLFNIAFGLTVSHIPAVVFDHSGNRFTEEITDNIDHLTEEENDGFMAYIEHDQLFPFVRALKRHEKALQEMQKWKST